VRFWVAVLLLLLVACAAAWSWHALAVDPGSVLVRFAGWRVETSFLVAVVGLLLLWGFAGLVWRLLFWPRAAWRRRARRRGRERIADGLVALGEGRYVQAIRAFDRAAHVPELHAPAQLARARAAQAGGDDVTATAALDQAMQVAAPAALALRARFLIERGRAADALALLKPELGKPSMSPAAWRSVVDAALQCGDADTALTALPALARSKALTPDAFAALEERTLCAALRSAADADRLNALWSGMSRAQRRIESVVIAYAQRAAALGLVLAGMSELESALGRDFSETLIRAYADLGPAESNTRLRKAEAWLDAKPNSAGLLLALGRLCNLAGLWGNAREYLLRALAVHSDPESFEALGDACAGQGDAATAQRAYRNALRSRRGESVEPLLDLVRGPLDTRASAVEERSEHGVPRLR
jgi:HemY protein